MKKILAALAVLSAVTVASAEPAKPEIEITIGRMYTRSAVAHQPISVANNTDKLLAVALGECGFFLGKQLAATALFNAQNLQPGKTAFVEASAIDAEADRAECRITSVRYSK
jgi:hypothetical protein